jgi:hypothetical protein
MKKLTTIFALIAVTCLASDPAFVLVGMRADLKTNKKAKVLKAMTELGIIAVPREVTDGTNTWLIANFWRQQLNHTITPEKFSAITNAVSDSAKFFVIPTDDPQGELNKRGLK